jgi:hypothetical protein
MDAGSLQAWKASEDVTTVQQADSREAWRRS